MSSLARQVLANQYTCIVGNAWDPEHNARRASRAKMATAIHGDDRMVATVITMTAETIRCELHGRGK